MRLRLLTHPFVTAAVIAGGAVGLLSGAGSASATVPGPNGIIVMGKCEDGPTSCNATHIWTIDPASGSEHQLTSGASYGDYDPAVSPDGNTVAFQRCPTGGVCRIAEVSIGGGAVTNVTAGSYDEDYPAWSPDGSKIVFSRNDPVNGGTHLVVMDASGGNEQPLTSGTAKDYSPAWSPDGSTVAFERYDAGSARIYKIAASGGAPVPLTAGPNDYSPNFSPDGSRIAFQGAYKIQIMDASGANQHVLTAPPADYNDGEPAFSPDGTQIAFYRYTLLSPRTAPLLVMNADGSNQHLISGSSERLFRPAWSTHMAAPSGGSAGAGSTPAADTTAPGLTLAAPKKESIRKGRVYLFATSSETAAGAAKGKVAVPQPAKSYRLRPSSKTLAANTRTKIWLKVPRKTLRAVRSALARHERVKATLVVRVKDSAGNATTKRLKVRLTR